MNSYLETAIAVIFVIVVFSIIAYIIQELIAANLQYRGKMLKNSLKLLLDGRGNMSTIVDNIYNHPQIHKLQELSEKLPSYVPSANFALALIDQVAKNAPAASGDLFNDFKAGITAFTAANGDLKTLLTDYLNTSSNIKELQVNIEKWFNEYMDRVTGWYKKNTAITMRLIAVAVAIGFNVDLIKITKAINSNSTLKANLVAAADKLADQPSYIKNLYEDNINKRLSLAAASHKAELDSVTNAKDSSGITAVNIKIEADKDSILKNYTKNRIVDIDTLLSKIDPSELPIGWNRNMITEVRKDWLTTFIGWSLAAVAIMLGAPFWFDLLMKLVNIRRAGIKPKTSTSN